MKLLEVRRLLDAWFIITSMFHVTAYAYNRCVAQQPLKCEGVNYTSVRCSWSPVINNQYTVQWFLDSSVICEDSPLINSSYICDIHNLGSGYYRRILINATFQNQTEILQTYYSAMECAVPNPPSKVFAKPLTSNSFEVSWTVPKDWPLDNEQLLSYQIQYQSEFDNKWREAKDSHTQKPPYSQTVSNVPYHCSSYKVKIICRTSGVTGKQSAWSNIVSVRTTQLAPIGEIHNIDFQHLYDKKDSRRVLLMWKPIPLTKACSPILGYYIMVCSAPDKCTVISIPYNSTQYYVKDLDASLAYTIYLSAYNIVGQSQMVNITIPAGVPSTQQDITSNSKDRYVLYVGLIVPLIILTVILTRLVYHKLTTLFQPVPEPNIPSFPEYKNSTLYKSDHKDKEFYTLLNENNDNLPRNIEVKIEKPPVYQYRSVSVSDSGELEVVEYQLLLCEDYVKSVSEEDLSGYSGNSKDSISPYTRLAGDASFYSGGSKPIAQDTSKYVRPKVASNTIRSEKIAMQGKLLEKKLQQRNCKFIVCREDGYAVIVEDVRQREINS
ncbi:uncharacterized protein [Antedon mediterranea]|uniref:uncharacterized protein n=1 Tax=Antedon mediterranea TaxID=105859 RepID=UPI003AF7B93A